MSNTIITPTVIAKEALVSLKNNLVMGSQVHRDYKKEFVKIGDTVTIRKPVKFVAKSGATRVNQDVTETSTSIVVNQQEHVSWNFSSADLTMSIAEYTARYINPACIALANKIDYDLCGLYKDVPNVVGTVGTVPNTYGFIGEVARRLDDNAAPQDSRRLVMNPATRWTMMTGTNMATYYSQQTANALLKNGMVQDLGNMSLFQDQNIRTHTCGTRDATGGTTSAASVEGATTIAITGAGNDDTVLAGDVFTIAGVYAVNPVSRQSTGVLKQFVVTADVTLDGSGAGTLTVSEAIRSTAATGPQEPYANVNALPASGAAVVFVGTSGTAYARNMGFHKNAFALVTCPLAVPQGVPFSASQTYDGYSIRIVKSYDITNDVDIIRLDVLYGVKTIYPELACCLTT